MTLIYGLNSHLSYLLLGGKTFQPWCWAACLHLKTIIASNDTHNVNNNNNSMVGKSNLSHLRWRQFLMWSAVITKWSTLWYSYSQNYWKLNVTALSGQSQFCTSTESSQRVSKLQKWGRSTGRTLFCCGSVAHPVEKKGFFEDFTGCTAAPVCQQC